MRANKVWVTAFLVALGLNVFLLDKLSKIDAQADKEIKKCHDVLYQAARYGLETGCVTGIRNTCEKFVDCNEDINYTIYDICYNMGQE
jgi:hypothetical protein